MQNLSNKNHQTTEQQTTEQNVVFLRTLGFRLLSPRRRNRYAMMDQRGTFCFHVIISVTIGPFIRGKIRRERSV